MDEETTHGDERAEAYDPENVSLPSRAPPLRSTAPQSGFTPRQVAIGAVVLAVGLVVTFGLPIALA
ncbi:DUF7550 family protein [Halapricum desulfuricans]|uniref:Membrane protein n=1 Tax=Halapricum desulfuricans TaxID=2841257 RepID=A0A897N6Y7_9EURY|nr:hypothetical protein [Halapricum desulfuricans]QSG06809.1 Membrane protein [Halapricum desulfuricans]